MAEELETDVWKEIRGGVLKAGLLAGTIPGEPKKIRPKEVYQKNFVGTSCKDESSHTSIELAYGTTVAWI
jgi:hypothetical protein